MKNILRVVILFLSFFQMQATTEKTFAMIKPFAAKMEDITVDILKNIEDAGFMIIAKKQITLSVDDVYQLYQDKNDRPWFPAYVKLMTASPVIVMILEKNNAVYDWDRLKIIIRDKYSVICRRNNVVHGSDTVQDAQREIALFFNDQELIG